MNQQFTSEESKIIAVDFDGTIVEHDYPRIGKEMLFYGLLEREKP